MVLSVYQQSDTTFRPTARESPEDQRDSERPAGGHRLGSAPCLIRIRAAGTKRAQQRQGSKLPSSSFPKSLGPFFGGETSRQFTRAHKHTPLHAHNPFQEEVHTNTSSCFIPRLPTNLTTLGQLSSPVSHRLLFCTSLIEPFTGDTFLRKHFLPNST